MLAACLTSLLLVSSTPFRIPEAAAEARRLPGIDRFLPVTENVTTGSSPRGEAGLTSLHELGIRTILSVDATAPAASDAAALGMRYVHVPIGYDRIDDDAAVRIAKVIRDLPGPIFVHCHHGRYRGPAAAAFGLRAAGRLDRAAAVAAFAATGDPEPYPGLRDAVANGPLPSARELDALTADDLPARARVADLAALMATLDHHHEHLREIAAEGWKPPPGHPDLVPAAEAAAVVELLRRAVELPPVEGDVDGFAEHLRAALGSARELEAAVVAGHAEGATQGHATLAATCVACHVRYRDPGVPPPRTNRKHEGTDRKP